MDKSPSTLVEHLMGQMENENGSYDVDNGCFINRNAAQSQNSHKLLQQKFIGMVQSNLEIRNLIRTHPNASQFIDEILKNEDLLKRIVEDEDVENFPALLKSILEDQPEQSVQPSSADHKLHFAPTGNQQTQLPGTASISPHPSTMSSQAPVMSLPAPVLAKSAGVLDFGPRSLDYDQLKESPLGMGLLRSTNWIELLGRPLIAMITYFAVTQTPLLLYLGKIPYIGETLSYNYSVTGLLLTGAIFLIIDTLASSSGWIA